MYKFEGWLGHDAEASEGKMVWGEFEPKTFNEHDIDIRVTHCGICGTDVHVLRSDWGPTTYPCCVGHEVVGKAVRVGSAVKSIKVGDRIGVGPQARSCFRDDCYECSSGKVNYCPRAVPTFNGTYPDGEGRSFGGFGNYVRTDSRFAVKIPDGLPSEHVAPMLCAGSTLYASLKKYRCGPGKTVGIVGIGGLGHFGILFAKALDADRVVAISRGLSKRDDALALGADAFIATGEDPEWASKNERTLDLLLVTSSGSNMPIDQYMTVLKTGGSIIQLGADPGGQHPSFSLLTLLYKELNIAGAICGSPSEMEEMMDLAVKRNVKPWVQTIPMTEANQALRDLESGKPRYRFVLVNDGSN
ncbi:hypothetical protein V2G26_005564 [Clonostachys chloroleuca]